MSLASTADAVGAEIAQALNGLPKGEDQSAQAWSIVTQKIAAWITSEAKATIPIGAIATTGTPESHTGPAAPVQLSIT